jgi:predicted nucleotidyltransferase
MTDKDLQERIIKKIKPLDPYKVILFGSYAYGYPSDDSDIDLLVVTNDEFIPNDFDERNRLFLNVASALYDIEVDFPIDLIVHTKSMHKQFMELNSMFSRKILSDGKVIYERNN